MVESIEAIQAERHHKWPAYEEIFCLEMSVILQEIAFPSLSRLGKLEKHIFYGTQDLKFTFPLQKVDVVFKRFFF